MKTKVAAVVVTYNRKTLLVECLNAIRKQSYLPDAIYIIDNLSVDGTPEILLETNYIPTLPQKNPSHNEIIRNDILANKSSNKKIQIVYTRKFENDGGAGGFNEGMKQSFEDGNEWIWMMDDDGVPDKEQLFNLLIAPKRYKYRNALVVDCNDSTKLSFGIKNYKKVEDIIEKDIIENEANPFNGTIIHREIIEKIGFIKKEMFIWGDESEYLNRTKKYNFHVATIIDAKHIHPENKGKTERIIPFIKKGYVTIKPYKLAHIFYRNLGFIQNEYFSTKLKIHTIISYSSFFIIRMQFGSLIKFIKFYTKGLRNDFK